MLSGVFVFANCSGAEWLGAGVALGGRRAALARPAAELQGLQLSAEVLLAVARMRGSTSSGCSIADRRRPPVAQSSDPWSIRTRVARTL